MTKSNDNLFTKYLAGESDADEVQRLNQTLADDPQAADRLISEAYLDVHLRETLSGTALGAAITKEVEPSKPCAGRWLVSRWVAAAVLLVAISGWIVAAYVAVELSEARTDIDTLSGRVAELEQGSSKPPVEIVKTGAPEIYSLRGWLWALPQPGAAKRQTLMVGAAAPLNRNLLTCPWGAAEIRYSSDVSITVERNTIVELSEADEGVRRLALKRGIVHVTNLSRTDKRVTEINSKLATVRLKRGQVAVQVDERRTAVEAAVGQVEVLVDVNGAASSYTLKRGQYMTITPGKKPELVDGMLKLDLEPPNS